MNPQRVIKRAECKQQGMPSLLCLFVCLFSLFHLMFVCFVLLGECVCGSGGTFVSFLGTSASSTQLIMITAYTSV